VVNISLSVHIMFRADYNKYEMKKKCRVGSIFQEKIEESDRTVQVELMAFGLI
jgi:hypothetical protein